jgi:hypothetical protein
MFHSNRTKNMDVEIKMQAFFNGFQCNLNILKYFSRIVGLSLNALSVEGLVGKVTSSTIMNYGSGLFLASIM